MQRTTGLIKRLQHRLGDDKGMTILMALFAFLVAAMVAAVILAAAMSSMRQAKDNQQHQQDMLILQSAGQLIEREMLNTKIEIKDVTTYENGNAKSTTRSVSTDSTALFASQVSAAVEAMYPLGTGASTADFTSGTSTITVAAGNFKQDVDVSFVYKMPTSDSATSDEKTRSEHLIFTLTTEGSDADSSHSLIVEFDSPSKTEATSQDRKNNVLTKSTTTKTLSWSTPNYKRVGGDK